MEHITDALQSETLTIKDPGGYLWLKFSDKPYAEIINLEVSAKRRGHKRSIALMQKAAAKALERGESYLRIEAQNERALSALRHVVVESTVKVVKSGAADGPLNAGTTLDDAIEALQKYREKSSGQENNSTEILTAFVAVVGEIQQ